MMTSSTRRRHVVLLIALSLASCHGLSAVLAACAEATARLALPSAAAERVEGYVRLLLEYNEHTNVYSKSAYEKLPFHIEDSVRLAALAGGMASRGVLDVGSGSGLPSVITACVSPELPVFAVESKSRKTRFLAHCASELGLERYVPLTQNVRELCRSWAFDVDVVTAKAFKPLPEVGPIARRCISRSATLLVPISEAQVAEFSLGEAQLVREAGRFVYYSEAVEPSHGVEQRKMVSLEAARASRL